MNGLHFVAPALSLVLLGSCAGRPMTSASPTGPSFMPTPAVPTTASPDAPRSRLIRGTVEPLGHVEPCFANRYNCAAYDFSLAHAGPIEVTMTWEGPPRAMLLQLYWAGEGLAHEDVAPRDGPSRIWFRRPLMEATTYRLRVVSLEPEMAIPFTLTVTH